MKRRLLNLLATLSLLLCLAGVALSVGAYAASLAAPWAWERSFGHSADPLNEVGAASVGGYVVVGWRRTFYRPVRPSDTPRLSLGGLVLTATRESADKVRYRVAATRPALVCLAGAFAAPSVLLLLHAHRRRRRERRRARGLCMHCGYDLTGNLTGVCPECGRAT